MKTFIIIISFAISISLFVENLRLKNKPVKTDCNHYYKSDLSREEMLHALFNSANDSISVFLPGDTSVMPYLVKSKQQHNEY